jgi:hypothetical protein
VYDFKKGNSIVSVIGILQNFFLAEQRKPLGSVNDSGFVKVISAKFKKDERKGGYSRINGRSSVEDKTSRMFVGMQRAKALTKILC